ncbi:hypothetical protein ABEW34_01930 [Paenibacillus algorifonticola]|uniref:hypothetical protein n=1 Tax=Paenibacillus algorifonticola TaxID=684063 RepID=UPI003D2C66F2
MESNNLILLADMLGISPDSPAYDLLEGSADAVPYIGKLYNAYKMHRLQARVKKIESRLLTIASLMIEKNDELLNEFIRKKAFPFTLNELFEEQEEEKVDLIMNGLEYTYKNNIRDESRMMGYFDVLRELRIDGLKRLIKYSERSRIQESNYLPDDPEELKLYYENEGYTSYIDNQLEKLGLIDTGIRSLDDVVNQVFEHLNKLMSSRYNSHFSARRHETKLTSFGNNFISFFELTIMIEIPAD